MADLAVRRCLHCHLLEAMNAWTMAYGGSARLNDAANHVVSFVCDFAETHSEPGAPRADFANNIAIGFQLAMANRIHRKPGDDGAPISAPADLARH